MLPIIKLRLLRLKDEYLVFVLMTVMAIGLTFVFGTFMGGEYKPSAVIVDEDQSRLSIMLVDELISYKGFYFSKSDLESAQKEVEEGKILASLVIRNGFQEDIDRGKQVTLGVIKVKDDLDILTLDRLIKEGVAKVVTNSRMAELTTDAICSNKADVDKESILNETYARIVESWEYRKPVMVSLDILEADNSNGYDNIKHMMIGFSVFFSMYTIVFGIGTILYDKEYRTWQRMLVTPVPKASILAGSMVTAYLMGALQLFILILAGQYIFRIDWGNSLGGVLIVAAAFIFAVTCLGLFLASIVKTHSQLSAISPVVLTSTAMLGGCMWPLEIVNSKILLVLANLTPQKWAIQGMEKIACYGQGFQAAIPSTLVLILMGMIYFIAGVKLIRNSDS